MLVVFTDLDGTLLERDSYSFEAARPALERLERRDIPVVFVTSKTRAETEFWRARIGNRHPFVVENGGALYVPADYFVFELEGFGRRGKYQVLELGTPYAALVATLGDAARASGCRTRGFHDLTDEEVARVSNLPLEHARLARIREYDEPFLIVEGDPAKLAREIESRGMRYTRGGRFHHILGANDKGVAVERAIELYRRAWGNVETIGLGDAPNDEAFLNLVDRPVMLRDPAGPEGWNKAILEMVPE